MIGQTKIAATQTTIKHHPQSPLTATTIIPILYVKRTRMKSLVICRSALAALLALLLFATAGCKTSILAQRGPYLHAYHEGHFSEAEQRLDNLVCTTRTNEDYQASSESSWVLLDRATTRLAMGKVDEAIVDYSQALEALDYYGQDLPAEQCAQILLQDETAAYQAADFEQVLARVYFALALLHINDDANAFALLRQAEDYQQEKRELYAKVPFTKNYRLADNGLSKYLFALLLERRGDYSNADIIYQQAHQLLPTCSGVPFQSSRSPTQATVMIICHNGNSPYKISATNAASVASACALEIILAGQRIDPAWSTLTGIPVPALRNWPGSSPQPTFAVLDGMRQPLEPFYNVRSAAADELDQKMPVIVARGVARLLTRRTAVGYLNKQDPCLGMLADLTLFIVNEQTRADTRSWTTLPAVIDAARFDIEPGVHQLILQIYDNHCPETRTIPLNLHPHELCVIHIFNIHPGVRQILIPANQGDSL